MAREDHFRIWYRIFFAVCAFAFRVVYAWYAGIDLTRPGDLQTHFWLWTGVFCALVYAVIMPAKRTQYRHPNQRSTDRKPFNTSERQTGERQEQ